MSRFFRQPWTEPRTDQYSGWGSVIFYTEFDDEGWAVRQLEVYQSGDVLAYDRSHMHDEYGGLVDQRFDEDTRRRMVVPPWRIYEISKEEFERVWTSVRPRNRRGVPGPPG
jgi:uncharacterized protein DUF6881